MIKSDDEHGGEWVEMYRMWTWTLIYMSKIEATKLFNRYLLKLYIIKHVQVCGYSWPTVILKMNPLISLEIYWSPGKIENKICLFISMNYLLYVKSEIILLCSKRDGRWATDVYGSLYEGCDKGMLLVSKVKALNFGLVKSGFFEESTVSFLWAGATFWKSL